jgi:hypothetical protein
MCSLSLRRCWRPLTRSPYIRSCDGHARRCSRPRTPCRCSCVDYARRCSLRSACTCVCGGYARRCSCPRSPCRCFASGYADTCSGSCPRSPCTATRHLLCWRLCSHFPRPLCGELLIRCRCPCLSSALAALSRSASSSACRSCSPVPAPCPRDHAPRGTRNTLNPTQCPAVCRVRTA